MTAKILIIEDEQQMRRNIASLLRLEGLEPIVAANGAEGLAMARSERPAMILCDVMMPELDGYGVLRELRADPSFATTPFLFLTAKGERLDIRVGMNAGADDYLTKPVDIDDLLAAIRMRLERRTSVERAIQAGPSFDSARPLETALSLTPREAEVLLWVAQGKANSDIAIILDTGESTVKKHLEHIYLKLGVENRGAAAFAAVRALSSPATS
jgi:DNA-binding NarL/FixJ family response regulator